MILEVGAGGGGGGGRDTKCLKGLKTTNAIMEIAEKQLKRSKKGSFSLHIWSPGSPKEMELVEPGEGPSRSPPRFLQPWSLSCGFGVVSSPYYPHTYCRNPGMLSTFWTLSKSK